MSKWMLVVWCVVGCGRAVVPGVDVEEPRVEAPGSNAPEGTKAPPQPGPDAAAEQLAREERLELERFLAPVAPGGAVYFGQVSARDNLGTVGTQYRDGVISGTVLAALERRAAGALPQGCASGVALTLVSSAQGRAVTVTQCAPGSAATTWVGLVNPFGTSGGVTGRCSGCAPALEAAPETLRLGPLSATGAFGTGQTMSVSLEATLQKRTSVTFAELIELAQPSYERRELAKKFVRAGEGWTLERTLQRSTPTSVPPGGHFSSCELRTAWTAQWYVADPVGSYEVRRVTAGATQQCCREIEGPGCAPDTTVCFNPQPGS